MSFFGHLNIRWLMTHTASEDKAGNDLRDHTVEDKTSPREWLVFIIWQS